MTPYFMVWSPGEDPPRVKHKSIGVAKREAQRLANLYVGKTFIVLKAKYSFTVYKQVSLPSDPSSPAEEGVPGNLGNGGIPVTPASSEAA